MVAAVVGVAVVAAVVGVVGLHIENQQRIHTPGSARHVKRDTSKQVFRVS